MSYYICDQRALADEKNWQDYILGVFETKKKMIECIKDDSFIPHGVPCSDNGGLLGPKGFGKGGVMWDILDFEEGGIPIIKKEVKLK